MLQPAQACLDAAVAANDDFDHAGWEVPWVFKLCGGTEQNRSEPGAGVERKCSIPFLLPAAPTPAAKNEEPEKSRNSPAQLIEIIPVRRRRPSSATKRGRMFRRVERIEGSGRLILLPAAKELEDCFQDFDRVVIKIKRVLGGGTGFARSGGGVLRRLGFVGHAARRTESFMRLACERFGK
jgi:hypothetical protein